MSVVGALVPQIRQAEIVRARHKPTESLDAHISHMRGVASFHTWSREGIETALKHLRRAIELDPNYSSPYGIGAELPRRAQGGGVDDRSRSGYRRDPAPGGKRTRKSGTTTALPSPRAALPSPISWASSTKASN